MDSKKQKLLIEYLLSSVDTFALCQNIVKSEYFDPEYRNAVKFIKTYFDKYHTTPDIDQVEAETTLKFDVQPISIDKVSYCADEIETFCQYSAVVKAVMESPKLIQQEDYGTVLKNVQDAVAVSLNRNLGLRYFDNVEDRLERMSTENVVEPTGWSEMDDNLYGGISRKELLLVSANSGGGKSITLANLAKNFSERGKSVLYISLELSEDVIAQRFDTMFTGISRKNWKLHKSEIITTLANEKNQNGTIDIIQMPSGTTSNTIRSYLKEYYLHYDTMPDLLILDYLDNMNPNERVSADNVFEKDKRCAEQLRQIAVDYNMFCATASQLNRTAIGATHHDHSQIAGGISKINVADVYWSIIMTDTMRAAGEIAFILQKTRNSDGVGKTIYLKWINNRLLIVDNEDKPAISFTSSKTSNLKEELTKTPTGTGLLDIMPGGFVENVIEK